MSHELLYTSAPAGLKPGTVGFSAVESTQGMPRLLSESLELLSAYRWEYVPPDPRSALNPVNFSHLLFRTGGQKYRILSRVADAGMDYTGRTNKLAHHVVLEPHELAPGGPAFTLAAPDFCVTQFSGEARWLAEGRRPKHGTAPPGPCRAWHTATNGHPGWAGVVAASALDGDSRPMNVIFPAGLETLPLVVEAMKLLPANRMWETSFSTYFTTLPPGFDCQWRFLLEGTREAEAARAAGGPRLIDLARGVGPAPDTELAYLAAHGTPRPAGVAPRAAAAIAAPTVAPRPTVAPQSRPTVRVPRDDEIEELAARSRWNLPLALTAAALAIGIVGLGLWAVLAPPPVTVADPLPDAPVIATSEKAHSKSELDRILEQAAEPEPVVTPVATTQVAPETTTDTTQTTETKPEEVTTEIVELPPALQDVKGKNGTLELPPLDANFAQAAEPKPLTRIYVRKADECELDILTLTGEKDDGFEVQAPEYDAASNTRTWVVTRNILANTGGITKTPVGEFKLKDVDLSFAWNAGAPEWAHPMKLMYRKLELRVGKSIETCFLSQALVVDAEPVPFSTNQKVVIPLRPNSVDPSQKLRLEVQLRGFSPTMGTISFLSGEKKVVPLPFKDKDFGLHYAIGFMKDGSSEVLELMLRITGKRPNVTKNRSFLAERLMIPDVLYPQGDEEPFVISTLKSFPREATADVARLNAGLAVLQKTEKALQAEIAKFRDEIARLNNDQQKAPLRALIDIRNKKLDLIDSEASKLREGQRVVSDFAAWCTEMEPRIRSLQGMVTVEYEAFVDDADARFPLVRTKNFESRSQE